MGLIAHDAVPAINLPIVASLDCFQEGAQRAVELLRLLEVRKMARARNDMLLRLGDAIRHSLGI